MSRKQTNRVLVTAASMLLATGIAAWPSDASAGDPSPTEGKGKSAEVKADTKAAPGKAEKAAEKAADKIEKAADKVADKADKAADKIGEKADKLADKLDKKDPAERAARQAKQREMQRDQLKTSLKGPMTEAMKQELRRHAQRTARIERIKNVALEAKDKDTAEKADKLLAKENARHDKWMSTAFAASTTATPPSPTAKPLEPNAKVEPTKGGAR